jgi:hypothetical protein
MHLLAAFCCHPRLCLLVKPATSGAGKTTLLNEILANQAGQRVAVLVNDMAALNIDQRLVQDSVVQQEGQQLVALSNGCICCTIRDDLLHTVRELAAQQVRAKLLAWCRDATACAHEPPSVRCVRLDNCCCCLSCCSPC